MRSFLTFALGLAALAACGSEEPSPHGPVDASTPPLGVDSGSSALTAPVGVPASFRIGYDTNGCQSVTCPVYRVFVANDGTVDLEVRGPVPPTRAAKTQVPKDTAQALYTDLVAANFFGLRDQYLEGEECLVSITSGTLRLWSIELDGKAKRVQRYTGCQAEDDLTALDALSEGLARRLGIEALIAVPPPAPRPDPDDLALSYRVTHAGQGVGVLRFDALHAWWSLLGCDGKALAAGLWQGAELLWGPPLPSDVDLPQPSAAGTENVVSLPGVGEVDRLLFKQTFDGVELSGRLGASEIELTALAGSEC